MFLLMFRDEGRAYSPAEQNIRDYDTNEMMAVIHHFVSGSLNFAISYSIDIIVERKEESDISPLM